jgi:hypothetical protein
MFDLGEYEKAIEWQRKSWLLSAPSNSNSFYVLCTYMLTRYARDDHLKPIMEPFLLMEQCHITSPINIGIPCKMFEHFYLYYTMQCGPGCPNSVAV